MQYTARSTGVRLHRTSNPKLREPPLTIGTVVGELSTFGTIGVGPGRISPEGGGCIRGGTSGTSRS